MVQNSSFIFYLNHILWPFAFADIIGVNWGENIVHVDSIRDLVDDFFRLIPQGRGFWEETFVHGCLHRVGGRVHRGESGIVDERGGKQVGRPSKDRVDRAYPRVAKVDAL